MTIETLARVEPGDHVVQFYAHDDELAETVSAYVADGWRAGEVAIVVATERHQSAFDAALRIRGVDVDSARVAGTIVFLDAAPTLSAFTTGPDLDADAFDDVVGGVVRDAARSGRPLRVYGEMVALLWDAGHVGQAIELESLWNDLRRVTPFSLFCAYPAQSVAGDEHADALDAVCLLHSAIIDPASRASEVRHFAAGPTAPRAARHFVTGTLEQWGRGEFRDDAAVVVTELATNAVVHAESDFVVTLSSLRDGIRVAVGDTSSVAPIRCETPSSTATSGRGVALVAAIATDWDTDVADGGKVVWAELRR